MALSTEVLSRPRRAASFTATSPWVWAKAWLEVRINPPSTRNKTIKPTFEYLLAFMVPPFKNVWVFSKLVGGI
jgi:hypothetical protein